MPNKIIYTLTLIELLKYKEKFPGLEIFLDNILKNINVIESVKYNINSFLLNIIIPTIILNKSIIKPDINEKELKELYRKLIINSDKFEKLIIRTIYDIDVTRLDFIKKNGTEKNNN
ncbi:hypothetical protein YN1_7260 [Nanoarchaeota archaeon]